VISRPDATGFSLLENRGPNLGVGGVGMVLSKVTVTLPDALREHLIEPPFFVSHPQTLIGPLSISPFDLVRGLSEALEQPTAESLKSKYFQNQVIENAKR